MKNEKDMMADKEKWIVETATTIENKIFERLEKCIEQSEWEYWEKSFIPIDYKNIEAIAQEVFEERKDKSFAEKYPNITNQVWEKALRSVEEKLKACGWKMGSNSNNVFGVGAAESDIVQIGEKRSLWKKIKKFFSKIITTRKTGGFNMPYKGI